MGSKDFFFFFCLRLGLVSSPRRGGLPVVPSSKIGGQGVGQDVFKWAGEGEAE